VISGIRLPCTAGLAFPLRPLVSVAWADKSVPHTRQRLASRLTRVPQVGHIFEGDDLGSGLIDSD
jgi:hypothetical protein